MKSILLTCIFVTLVLAVVGSEAGSGTVDHSGWMQTCFEEAKKCTTNGTCDPVKSNKKFAECMCRYLSDKNICDPMELQVHMVEGLMHEKSGGNVLITLLKNLTKVLTEILGIVPGLLGNVTDIVTNVTDPIIDILTNVTDPVTDILTNVTDPVTDIVTNVTDPVIDILTNVTDPVTDIVTGVLGR